MNFDIKKVKIFTTIPKENSEELINAVCNAGAGIIGNYSFCTCIASVTGTFKPNEDCNPYIGTINNLEKVEEDKIEFICDVDKVKNVVKELRRVHPYEELMIDIVPLLDERDFK